MESFDDIFSRAVSEHLLKVPEKIELDQLKESYRWGFNVWLDDKFTTNYTEEKYDSLITFKNFSDFLAEDDAFAEESEKYKKGQIRLSNTQEIDAVLNFIATSPFAIQGISNDFVFSRLNKLLYGKNCQMISGFDFGLIINHLVEDQYIKQDKAKVTITYKGKFFNEQGGYGGVQDRAKFEKERIRKLEEKTLGLSTAMTWLTLLLAVGSVGLLLWEMRHFLARLICDC